MDVDLIPSNDNSEFIPESEVEGNVKRLDGSDTLKRKGEDKDLHGKNSFISDMTAWYMWQGWNYQSDKGVK